MGNKLGTLTTHNFIQGDCLIQVWLYDKPTSDGNTNEWELMFENKTHFQLFNILQEMGEKLKCIDNHKTQPNHF